MTLARPAGARSSNRRNKANLGGGRLNFRTRQGFRRGVLYRVRPDGTGLRKALEQPVLHLSGFSPDGRWMQAWASSENTTQVVETTWRRKGVFSLPGVANRSCPFRFQVLSGRPNRCFHLTVVHRLSSAAALSFSGRAVETPFGSPPERFPMAGVTLFHCHRAGYCQPYRREDFVSSRKSPVCRERA